MGIGVSVASVGIGLVGLEVGFGFQRIAVGLGVGDDAVSSVWVGKGISVGLCATLAAGVRAWRSFSSVR